MYIFCNQALASYRWLPLSSNVRLTDEGLLEIAMPRPKRTVEQLRAASEHLHHEVSMFDATGRALGSGLFGPGAATNAVLESFTVHTRALLQFLFPNDPKPDDVLAEDYFENPSIWRDLRGDLPEPLGVVNRRVGKEIAHLTYARLEVTPETKGWNIPVIWAAVLRLVQAFAKNVPQDRLGPSWQAPTSRSEA